MDFHYLLHVRNNCKIFLMWFQVKTSPLADSLDTALNHDDIVSLTYDVRSFSEALAKLKTVFSGEDEGTIQESEKLIV